MASDYTREQILDIVERQAQASGIPREDFLRFAYIETGGRFNPDASNPSGAKGLFQFMPGTAAQYGIAGREFDPAESTRAAAELYRDNMADITRRQTRSGHDFLSGQETPSGLDLYLAHQQGAAGYASIQSAIATGEFTRDDTRRNILNNISARDAERLTGHTTDELRGLGDRELATAFSQYWNGKYAAISIPDRGIQAGQPDAAARERTSPLADGVLQSGERGEEVRALQTSLNQLGFRDGQGAELETRSGIYGGKTQEAVRAFQAANQLEATGNADARTREVIAQQLALPEQERNRPQAVEAQQREGGLAWPTPGNRDINEADKPREGRGEFGTPRSGGRRHGGIDIQGDVGDPVVAVAAGTVVVRPNNGAAGNTVHVRHDDGTLTKYFHLDEFSVRNGQRVEAGQQIGTMGRTGNTPAQGDTHLHFEMWRDGRQVDPLPHLQGAERDAAVPTRAATPEVLRDGSSGASVRELQQQLNQLGYRGADGQPLETTSGKFGPQTEHALRAFQADRGLKVDGEYGDRSREALTTATRDAARDTTPAETTPQTVRGEDAQRSFVDRMFAAMHGGDDRAMRQALDDYLKTPGGQGWQQKEQPVAEQQVAQPRDQTGASR
ncbi:peptidoglycan-binding protein [Pseudoxanthomonas sp. PXM02]|uniref:peptidoglycan-binding protein n=1 Tax=Pseudoxanthomonas sp. PXM02 TaxID=2769294 RepID=UPI001781E650|nr:peptidoglycan-binding protein [Pseudoxanthomonas sp. PXM02]MBD9479324.1 peptidoglycan-binding protein [Pseudoxanthomonas sp. PXM02]